MTEGFQESLKGPVGEVLYHHCALTGSSIEGSEDVIKIFSPKGVQVTMVYLMKGVWFCQASNTETLAYMQHPYLISDWLRGVLGSYHREGQVN